MDLPVKFPSETEVILEDVARFRALSPQDRFEVIRDMLITAAFIMRISPKAAWARQYAIDEAELERLAIREFIARAMDTDAGHNSDESVRAVEFLSDAFDRRSIRHALIGGLAISMRGRPRSTQGVDFLVDMPVIVLPALLDELLERGFSFDQAIVIKEYTREHITFIFFGDVRIGWLKPVLPFHSRALLDAEPLVWSEGHPIRVATPEGLILTKMVAFRAQDQIDIETLLTANRDTIDVERIREQWSLFADSEPERTAWLEAAIAKRVERRE